MPLPKFHCILILFLFFSILPCAKLSVNTSQLDFGIQVNEHQVVPGYFNIVNSGDLDGCFHLLSPLPSYLLISSSRGQLKPKQSQKIQVKLLCNEVGEIDEYFRLVYLKVVAGIPTHQYIV